MRFKDSSILILRQNSNCNERYNDSRLKFYQRFRTCDSNINHHTALWPRLSSIARRHPAGLPAVVFPQFLPSSRQDQNSKKASFLVVFHQSREQARQC